MRTSALVKVVRAEGFFPMVFLVVFFGIWQMTNHAVRRGKPGGLVQAAYFLG